MTRKTFLFSALLFVACLMFAGWTPLVHAADAPATVSATPQNVILISWDGLDRRILKQLLEEKKLPHLAALIEEGSLREITVVGHITVTKPGHAEMLTGLDIKDTGVESNMKYRPIPQGYTLFERVQKFLGGKEKIRTFMVTGKIAHVGGRGPGEGIGERPGMQPKKKFKATPGADDSPEKEVLGEPFFLTKKAL
ncbi:MAG TPA: alkaline phosphatase family protein, partial [Phycisphaerae bacterium]|nr:alkaline phosphatase family protein [Phycisphaerae bacterium]